MNIINLFSVTASAIQGRRAPDQIPEAKKQDGVPSRAHSHLWVRAEPNTGPKGVRGQCGVLRAADTGFVSLSLPHIGVDSFICLWCG